MHPTEESLLYTFITGLGVLTLTLLLIIISVIRHQRRRMREYADQLFRDLQLIEEERERIAADLHDDLGSLFALVRMNILNLLEKQPEIQILIHTNELLGTIQTRLKQISHNLMPQTLIREGFSHAIQDLVAEWNRPNQPVILHIAISDHHFKSNSALHIYRILQEMITNATKHAKHQLITISLTTTQKELIIDFSDDGQGFPAITQTTTRKFGLHNIQSRLQTLGAKHTMQSSPGKGTSYHITIPLENLIHA